MAGQRGMKPNPLDQLRDRMLEAPNDVDTLHMLPRLREAQQAFTRVISRLQRKRTPNDALVTVMFAEMLPRMVHQNGPESAAVTLAKLARSLSAGMSPAGKRQ
jgi:hypothetical protein